MTDEITLSVRMLNDIAQKLRKRRMEAGALTLASPEVKFVKDETDDPIDVDILLLLLFFFLKKKKKKKNCHCASIASLTSEQMYEHKETNFLVEEFMLLANISVAKKIYEHFPTFAMLRLTTLVSF